MRRSEFRVITYMAYCNFIKKTESCGIVEVKIICFGIQFNFKRINIIHCGYEIASQFSRFIDFFTGEKNKYTKDHQERERQTEFFHTNRISSLKLLVRKIAIQL